MGFVSAHSTLSTVSKSTSSSKISLAVFISSFNNREIASSNRAVANSGSLYIRAFIVSLKSLVNAIMATCSFISISAWILPQNPDVQ
jgi:hypothetical protein